jgi:hypothetical protein
MGTRLDSPCDCGSKMALILARSLAAAGVFGFSRSAALEAAAYAAGAASAAALMVIYVVRER